MFGPYRTPPEGPPVTTERPHEEIVLAWALILLGLLRVVVAIATRETWGAEATIAMVMVPAGVRILVRR